MATRVGLRSASSDRNIEVYREALEAFNRDGAEALFAFLDPEIELYDPDLPDGGVFRGHEGVRRFLDEILEGFEVIEIRDYELLPAGDRVVGLIHTYGRGTRGGIEVEIRDAHTWTFRDGKVIYWRLYLDRKEALADAGLDGG
jgi:ketosteroid isomerase-like protein